MPNNPYYRPRIVDAELDERLAAVAAVVIEGPKACGKPLPRAGGRPVSGLNWSRSQQATTPL